MGFSRLSVFRRAKHIAENISFEAFFVLMKLVGHRLGMNATGKLIRSLASVTPVLARAEEQLAIAMPEQTAADRRRVSLAMFDHFGRLLAEYMHLGVLTSEPERLEIVGLEHLIAARDAPQGAIFVTGHFGNWEAIRAVLNQHNWPLALMRRKLNNPYIDRRMLDLAKSFDAPTFMKYESGSALPRYLRKGGCVLFLIDQRMKETHALPFFGKPALTTLAPVKMSRLFNSPLIPVHATRLDGEMRYRIEFEAPVFVPPQADAEEIMTDLNARIERWVRETPEQYFWLHRRWKRAETAKNLSKDKGADL